MLEQLKHAAGSSILETHPHYRTAIGVFGVSLPPDPDAGLVAGISGDPRAPEFDQCLLSGDSRDDLD